MSEKNRSRGFSLIEIVVTIAVMALVTGASVSVYSWIKSHRIREISVNVNDAVSDVRSKTLTKSGKYELVIKYSSKKYIAQLNHTVGGSTTSTDKTISGVGTVYCKIGTTEYDLQDGKEIHIEFNKADGSFSKMHLYDPATGVWVGKPDAGYINVKYGGYTKKIKLIEATGKHYIE